MQKVDYSKAYSEVLEVINYISKNDYNNIPKKFITFMEENCSENSEFKYNLALPFDKQELSDKAKNILALIYRLFLASTKEKIELNKIDKFNSQNEEDKKRTVYNTDNIFKKEKIKKETENVKEETNLIEYKKSSFINFIKKILKKIHH